MPDFDFDGMPSTVIIDKINAPAKIKISIVVHLLLRILRCIVAEKLRFSNTI